MIDRGCGLIERNDFAIGEMVAVWHHRHFIDRKGLAVIFTVVLARSDDALAQSSFQDCREQPPTPRLKSQ